jgi:general secretion pathway protein E
MSSKRGHILSIVDGRDISSIAQPSNLNPPSNALPAIPYTFARDNGVVLIGTQDDSPAVAFRQGGNARVLIEVRRHIGQPFAIDVVDASAFEALLSERYTAAGTAEAIVGTIGEGHALDLLAHGLPTAEDILDTADDAPAIRLINGIIAEAAQNGVSDIHIEPYQTGLVFRMRVDGMLRETLRMPPHVAPVLVSRIKVMARMDIAERRMPQDGRIDLTLGGKQIDVRVSTLPSRSGERVVLRILDKGSEGLALDRLGMTHSVDRILRDALAEPNGIILVTGPTGSGKTTTLYAGLRALNDGSRNILTVEDPVEYVVEGIGQTQVNAKAGLTFAAGLRAILRQDPDVVMVGEIRDRETAEIAVQASLTGHLVLSTVHTNNAVGAITRMRNMDVEPFLLASTLRAVIAQRLVRRLCTACRQPIASDALLEDRLGIKPGSPVFRAHGCTGCNSSGYRGRVGVFEAIRVDDTVRQLMNDNADEVRITDHAFQNSPTLLSGARDAVLAGETSAEEAVRILRRESGQSDG